MQNSSPSRSMVDKVAQPVVDDHKKELIVYTRRTHKNNSEIPTQPQSHVTQPLTPGNEIPPTPTKQTSKKKIPAPTPTALI